MFRSYLLCCVEVITSKSRVLNSANGETLHPCIPEIQVTGFCNAYQSYYKSSEITKLVGLKRCCVLHNSVCSRSFGHSSPNASPHLG